MSREATTRLLDSAESGVLGWEAIARSCLRYMDESEVEDMAETEELFGLCALCSGGLGVDDDEVCSTCATADDDPTEDEDEEAEE